MSEFRAAHRYATALLGVAGERNLLEPVGKDLEGINSLIKQSTDFALFLKSPVVNTEKKKSVLSKIFAGKIEDLTLKFILLLASKGREGLLPAIIDRFSRLRDDRMGVIRASVRSAIPLGEAQQKELTRQLEQSTAKKVRLSLHTDPTLRGGFTVQYDDTVWDASIRHQLERLKQKFMDASV